MPYSLNFPRRRVVPFTAPAAGAEFTITPDKAALWRILSLRFVLTTDANVANRQVTLVADDGTTTFFQTGAVLNHAAGTALIYTTFEGAGVATTGFGTEHLPFPVPGVVLEQGFRLRSLTTAIQVGDQFSAIAALVQELPSGPDFFVWPSYVNDYEPTS